MSLINQMLKDLEQRRSQDSGGSAGVMPGVRRYSVATHRRSPWLTIFAVTILSLASLVGYLLWERNQQAARVDIASTKTDVLKPQQITLPQSQQSHQVSQPAATLKEQPVVKPVPQTEAPRNIIAQQAPAPVKVQKQQTQTVKSNDEDDASPATGLSQVKKVSRPLNPRQQSEVLYQKGYRLLAAGKSSAGEHALREALTLYPEHVKAREVLAGLYIKAGRVIEAGDLLQQGSELVPEHALFAQLQARLLLEQNRVAQAIHVLEQKAPVVNTHPEYHALLAAAYQRNKQHALAINKYQSILSVVPAAGVWWIGMAISLEAMGRQAEAQQAYQQAKKTGQLAVELVRYTNNRLSALRESGLPAQKSE